MSGLCLKELLCTGTGLSSTPAPRANAAQKQVVTGKMTLWCMGSAVVTLCTISTPFTPHVPVLHVLWMGEMAGM